MAHLHHSPFSPHKWTIEKCPFYHTESKGTFPTIVLVYRLSTLRWFLSFLRALRSASVSQCVLRSLLASFSRSANFIYSVIDINTAPLSTDSLFLLACSFIFYILILSIRSYAVLFAGPHCPTSFLRVVILFWSIKSSSWVHTKERSSRGCTASLIAID